ncbi:MAG: PAS domain S-box protein [Bacteroidia bacterium]
MQSTLSFSIAQFEDIFPFLILFNRQMKIEYVGRSLKKLCPHTLFQKAEDCLTFSRPSIAAFDFTTVTEYVKQVVVLTLKKDNPIMLRGEFLLLKETEQLLFLGSPWFHNIEELTENGLTLSDFAVHDAIIDLLHILKTQEIANQDTQHLLKTVKFQKNELSKLSMIVQETFNPVIITDAIGEIEWVNKAFEKLTGYVLSEIIKLRPGMILQGEETNPETVAYLREKIRKAEPFQCEIVNYTKDKRPYWISIMAQPVFSKKGVLTNFFAIEEDITERKLAEEKLKYSEEKYRSIIENMELGLLEVDNEGKIIRPFPRFCELVGYQANELIGKDALKLFVPLEYQTILAQQSVDRVTGKAGTYEIPLIHKNGNWVWVLISGAPIYDERGKIKGSIGIHYNLTERKNLEEKLALAKQVAENARQTEQQFLANMSHEIRTPLNAIIGMSHLLYDTRPSTEQKEYIDILNNSANFLHSLISNILDMAKIEAGKIELNYRPFDLIGIVSTLQKTFQMKLEGRPIEVEAMIDSRIKGFYIGDETTIHQILMNLLGNADKFTEEGLITISVRQLKKETDKIWIEFKITDTGIGISEDQLPLIFQKFKQVQDEKGAKYKGTGLGLSIVKELVDLQGGIISVTSKKGEGSCFAFVLPFEQSNENPQTQEQPISLNTQDFSGAYFLVVEDNIMNRKYLGSLLEKKKIQFDVAIDGLEAIRKVGQKKYDLILMDIQMPNMNGYEATLNIRSTQNLNNQTPIIALTASAMLDQKNKAFEVGMNDYISKPFTPQQLFDKLNLHLVAASANIESAQTEDEKAFEYHAQLDVAYLKELYAEDYGYAFSMFETFIQEMLPEFDNLQLYAEQHQTQKLAKLAHQLKPTTAMVGLTSLEKSLLALEGIAAKPETSQAELLSTVQSICAEIAAKKEVIIQQCEALKAQIP